MEVGFTGTRSGMNEYQKIGVHGVLRALKKHGHIEFHHGDCTGADEQSDEIAHDIGFTVIIHPPINPKQRAYCKNAYEIRDEKEYIDRNHDIVDETDILIAIPHEDTEIKRGSGTWATIRYAKKMKKPIVIIYPNKVEIVKSERKINGTSREKV